MGKVNNGMHCGISKTQDTEALTATDGSVGEEEERDPAPVPHPLQAERLSVEPVDAECVLSLLILPAMHN